MLYSEQSLERQEPNLDTPSWKEIKKVFYESFLRSQGRQYEQMYDLICFAAMWDEEGRDMDWATLDSPQAIDDVRSMRLTGWHIPVTTPGQVPGTFEFWFRNMRHALHQRFNGQPLPTNDELDDQMEACGLPLYGTSTSEYEELAAIHESFDRFRDPAAANMTSDELVLHGLDLLLISELRWQRHQRPRTDGRDVFESRWHTQARRALGKPPEHRTAYDKLNIKTARILDDVLAMPEEVAATNRHLRKIRHLYGRLVTAYNQNHPLDAQETLHK